MKIILRNNKSSIILAALLISFLLPLTDCTGPNQSLPKTPANLRLDPAERMVFRDGFHAGRTDKQRHLSVDSRRHQFTRQYEEIFRSGYITGVTFNWFFLGKEERIQREYPDYFDAYAAPFRESALHWIISFRPFLQY